MINTFFDKIYCLNLDRRQDRWAESEIEFKKHGLQVERFAAIDGNDIVLPPGSLIKTGDMGCLLSHIAIFKLMVEKGMQKILILEDDVEFAENFNELFNSLISQVPEFWDMIYFGGNHVTYPTKISENIGKLIQTYTTSHYAITNQMARYIIAEHGKYNAEVDVIFSKLHPITKCYTFMPKIAWQRPSYSDIQNRFTDYRTVIQ